MAGCFCRVVRPNRRPRTHWGIAMEDSFWERKTTFWEEDEEPTSSEPGAGPDLGSGMSRRSRRLRALSRRNKLASLCALLSSSALVVVVASGLVSRDVSHHPDGGRAAHAADGVQSGGHTVAASAGELGNAVPLASVTGVQPDPAKPGAAPPGGAAPVSGAASPSRAPVGGGNASAPPASSASAPAPAPASAPAPSPTSPPPPPATAPPPPPPPSCTIGLLGTCIVGGGGGVLP